MRIGLLSLLVLASFACHEPVPFQFTTFVLRDGKVNEPYADTIHTDGGCGNVSMQVIQGQLPPGIGLRTQERDGVLYGIATVAGDFEFTVEARDSFPGEEPGPVEVINHAFAVFIDSL